MKFRNTLTGEEFDSKTEYVESILKEYQRVSVESYRIKQEEADLIVQLVALDEKPGEAGTYKVEGKTLQAKVKKRFNVSYPKGDFDVSPITLLMEDEKFKPFLDDLFRISYAESGQKVEKFLQALNDTSVAQDLRELLMGYRKKSQGKPEIELRSLSVGGAG